MNRHKSVEARFAERIKRRIEHGPASLPTDPVAFCQATGLILWPRLEQVIDALGSSRRVVVSSGHGTGKSITASTLAAWWLTAHSPAKVVTIAPTHSQVQHILWRHIRSLDSRYNLPGEVYATPRWDIEPERFAIGLSPRRASQEDLQTLQGYHSPNLLVILDEAPALPRLLWDAVRGLVTGGNNRILAIGNPIEQAGPFHEACVSGNWQHIRISCLEHPNVVEDKDVIPGAVSRHWVEEMVGDHCTPAEHGHPEGFEWEGTWWLPDGVFQSRVLGLPPEEAISQLISLAWARGAQTTDSPPGEVVLGLDASRYGGDDSVIVARAGNRVLWVKRRRPKSRNPSNELAGWLKEEMERTRARQAFIDDIGIGAGVVDQARNLGLAVIGVGFGRAAKQRRRFANLRAECWWRVRTLLQRAEMQLPPDDMLAGDLTAPRYEWDRQGRILLEAKDAIRKRLGRSPDAGDALAITYAYDREGGQAPDLNWLDGLGPVSERGGAVDSSAPGPTTVGTGGSARRNSPGRLLAGRRRGSRWKR